MLPNRYPSRVRREKNNEEMPSFQFSSLGKEAGEVRWHRARRASSAGNIDRGSHYDGITSRRINDAQPRGSSRLDSRTDLTPRRSFHSSGKAYSSSETNIIDKRNKRYGWDNKPPKINREKEIKKARSDILNQMENRRSRSSSRASHRPQDSRSSSISRLNRRITSRSPSIPRSHSRSFRSVSRTRPDLY